MIRLDNKSWSLLPFEKAAPHNALTSIEKLNKSAQTKKYRTTSDKKSVLNSAPAVKGIKLQFFWIKIGLLGF